MIWQMLHRMTPHSEAELTEPRDRETSHMSVATVCISCTRCSLITTMARKSHRVTRQKWHRTSLDIANRDSLVCLKIRRSLRPK